MRIMKMKRREAKAVTTRSTATPAARPGGKNTGRRRTQGLFGALDTTPPPPGLRHTILSGRDMRAARRPTRGNVSLCFSLSFSFSASLLFSLSLARLLPGRGPAPPGLQESRRKGRIEPAGRGFHGAGGGGGAETAGRADAATATWDETEDEARRWEAESITPSLKCSFSAFILRVEKSPETRGPHTASPWPIARPPTLPPSSLSLLLPLSPQPPLPLSFALSVCLCAFIYVRLF